MASRFGTLKGMEQPGTTVCASVLIVLSAKAVVEIVWQLAFLAGCREAKEKGAGGALLEEACGTRTLLVQNTLHRVTN